MCQMKQNFPWSKNDSVITEDGTTVGRVKKTVELENGDHILILGDINPDLISFFPEQPSKSSEIDSKFSCGVGNISDYENGVVRLLSSAQEEFQSVYNHEVRLKMEEDLDKIEEAVNNGSKPSENVNPEVIHEVQEKIRGFRQTIRQGINEDRFNGKGEEYLRQMDRIEENSKIYCLNLLITSLSHLVQNGIKVQINHQILSSLPTDTKIQK